MRPLTREVRRILGPPIPRTENRTASPEAPPKHLARHLGSPEMPTGIIHPFWIEALKEAASEIPECGLRRCQSCGDAQRTASGERPRAPPRDPTPWEARGGLPERSPRSPRQAARHRPPAEHSRPRLRAAAKEAEPAVHRLDAALRRSAPGGLPTNADTRRAMPHIARCPAETPACTSSPPCSARHPVTDVSAWPTFLTCSRRPSAAAGCARLASLAVLAVQHQGRASAADQPGGRLKVLANVNT